MRVGVRPHVEKLSTCAECSMLTVLSVRRDVLSALVFI